MSRPADPADAAAIAAIYNHYVLATIVTFDNRRPRECGAQQSRDGKQASPSRVSERKHQHGERPHRQHPQQSKNLRPNQGRRRIAGLFRSQPTRAGLSCVSGQEGISYQWVAGTGLVAYRRIIPSGQSSFDNLADELCPTAPQNFSGGPTISMPWSAQSCFMTISWFLGISFPNPAIW